uniref:Uncharacterized protein n=1 Tax=Rhizophora mucronata TaxID=61149 RepID=A0A2P2IHH3_RHIMU
MLYALIFTDLEISFLFGFVCSFLSRFLSPLLYWRASFYPYFLASRFFMVIPSSLFQDLLRISLAGL